MSWSYNLNFAVTKLVWANPISLATTLGITFVRSEEHTSELQSRPHLVCRLLLEKKKVTHDRRVAAGPIGAKAGFPFSLVLVVGVGYFHIAVVDFQMVDTVSAVAAGGRLGRMDAL